MLSLSVIILTHSSNLRLWPPVFDLLHKYLKGIKINVMTDDESFFRNHVKHDNINIVYQYSDKDTTYFMRHSAITKMIDDKYVINFADNRFLTNADVPKLLNLLNTMELHQIDRLALYSDPTFYGNNRKIESIIGMDDNNFITESTVYFNFSAQPAIWNRESFIKLCDNFSYLRYRQTESEIVQIYMKNNFKVYHLHSYIDPHSSWNCKLVHYFEFVYVGSQWHPEPDAAYNSLKETVFSIIKEYNLEYNPKPFVYDARWDHN